MKYENEEQIRKDFARLFSWYKQRGVYGHSDEIRTPEWSEIFCKVGRLMEKESHCQGAAINKNPYHVTHLSDN